MGAPARAVGAAQNTPAWLDARRDFVGSSDVPVLTGSSPYRSTSVFALWAIKTRLAPLPPIDPDDQELFDLGHLLEDDIAELYTARTGRALQRASRMLVSRSIPWASASLDRRARAKKERRIVELKWAPHRWDDSAEELPAHVADQIQWQLLVSGYDVADVAVLRGSKLSIVEGIGPNDAHQADLIYIARWFRDLVERGERPPVDGSEATTKAINRLYPRDTEPLIESTAETDALAAQLRAAVAAKKAAELEDGRLRNVIRLVLDDHAGVEGNDYRFTYKKHADSRRVAWEGVASAQRKLLELVARAIEQEQLAKLTVDEQTAALMPALASSPPVVGPLSMSALLDAIETLHTTTSEGARVLRPYFRDEETGKWI